MIIFLHDAANVPLQLLMFTQRLQLPTEMVVGVFLFNLYMWGHFMLYCFPVEVLLPSVTEEHKAMPEWYIYWCMFGLLLVHHVYTYLRLLAYVPRVLKSPSGAVATGEQKVGHGQT